jgi:dihydrofolate reductase
VKRIVLFSGISIDGFIDGPDGDISWHRVDEELHAHMNQVIGGAAGLLEGRVSHQLMCEFWPTADQDPEAPPSIVEFAGIWRGLPKVVYSRTLASDDWATVVREVVPDEVRALQEGEGYLILGGANLSATFLELDLVDELRVYVHPVLVGAGRRLFPGGITSDWELEETHRFGNGVVLVRYVRAASPAAADSRH